MKHAYNYEGFADGTDGNEGFDGYDEIEDSENAVESSFFFSLLAILLVIFGSVALAHCATPAPIDLTPLIAKSGPVLECNGKLTYKLSAQAVLTKAITIHGNGATLIAPDEHAAFNCQHDDVIVSGFSCAKSNVFFYVTRGSDRCSLQNCKLTGVLKAVHVETGCVGTTAEEVIAVSGSVTFYSESGLVLINCRGRSIGEYAVRWEAGSTGNAVIGGEYTNAANVAGKDTFGDRWGDGVLNGAIFHGNMRVGQDKQVPIPSPGKFATIHISNCQFLDQSPGHGYIEILQGANVYDDGGNTFSPAKNPNWILSKDGGNAIHRASPATQPTK